MSECGPALVDTGPQATVAQIVGNGMPATTGDPEDKPESDRRALRRYQVSGQMGLWVFYQCCREHADCGESERHTFSELSISGEFPPKMWIAGAGKMDAFERFIQKSLIDPDTYRLSGSVFGSPAISRLRRVVWEVICESREDLIGFSCDLDPGPYAEKAMECCGVPPSLVTGKFSTSVGTERQHIYPYGTPPAPFEIGELPDVDRRSIFAD